MYLWSQWKHTGKMHIKKWVGARWRQKKFAYFWKKWVGGRGTRKKFAYFGRNRLGVRGSQKKFGYFGRKWVGGSIYDKNRFFHHLFRNFFPGPPWIWLLFSENLTHSSQIMEVSLIILCYVKLFLMILNRQIASLKRGF